ncbi:MAG TPA: hypothetical protein VMK32_14170 [Burkholderiaceae bacterium]|nr:hypothetical protein [Burkholderiaceae bacterium]
MVSLRAFTVFAALSLGGFASAQVIDPSADVAMARAAADAADEQLVELRRAVWTHLAAAQKPAFAQRERAWLGQTRRDEELTCLRSAIGPTALAAQTCRLVVTERHIAALSAPVVYAASNL